MCGDRHIIGEEVTQKVNAFAERGFRTIGVAIAPCKIKEDSEPLGWRLRRVRLKTSGYIPDTSSRSSRLTENVITTEYSIEKYDKALLKMISIKNTLRTTQISGYHLPNQKIIISPVTDSDYATPSNESTKWKFVGLIPLRDECRPRMKEIIRKATELGVQVKMITGDQTAIARETCRELDMGSLIYNADILAGAAEAGAEGSVVGSAGSALHEEEMTRIVENAAGFAEVFPEHK